MCLCQSSNRCQHNSFGKPFKLYSKNRFAFSKFFKSCIQTHELSKSIDNPT